MAAKEALADSGLQIAKENPHRVGVIVGAGMGGMVMGEREITLRFTDGGFSSNRQVNDGEHQPMATDSSISLKIRTTLGKCLKRDPATILSTQHLRDDLGLDSMEVIELLFRIETAFDLQIPDQDLVGLTNVGHVVSDVEKRLGKAASPAPTKKPAKPFKPKGQK